MRLAAAMPERIGAGGSFHGGDLATGDDSSPHLFVPQMKAGFLIAIAANDDEKYPAAKVLLRQAFDNAGLNAEIEVYKGNTAWPVPPDSVVYNEAQAERAWPRLLALFERRAGLIAGSNRHRLSRDGGFRSMFVEGSANLTHRGSKNLLPGPHVIAQLGGFRRHAPALARFFGRE